MEMTITSMPPQRLAAVRHRGPYQQIAPAFQTLGDIAGRTGLFARTTGHMMGIYWDDPQTVAAADLRSAAALPIVESGHVPDGLVELRFEGGRFARFVHVGPYEGLPGAWAAAVGTMLSSGHHRRDAPALEIYVNNPHEVSPAALRTEILIPID